MDDKLLDGYLGSASALEDCADRYAWNNIRLDDTCCTAAGDIRALVAEVRLQRRELLGCYDRLARRNDDGTCRGCGRLPSSCSCGAAPVACHACGHDSIPCQCPE